MTRVYLHPYRSGHISPHQHFYDHAIALIWGVYVCLQPWQFAAEATNCAFMPMGNIILKALLKAAVAYNAILQGGIKIRDWFFSKCKGIYVFDSPM